MWLGFSHSYESNYVSYLNLGPNLQLVNSSTQLSLASPTPRSRAKAFELDRFGTNGGKRTQKFGTRIRRDVKSELTLLEGNSEKENSEW